MISWLGLWRWTGRGSIDWSVSCRVRRLCFLVWNPRLVIISLCSRILPHKAPGLPSSIRCWSMMYHTDSLSVRPFPDRPSEAIIPFTQRVTVVLAGTDGDRPSGIYSCSPLKTRPSILTRIQSALVFCQGTPASPPSLPPLCIKAKHKLKIWSDAATTTMAPKKGELLSRSSFYHLIAEVREEIWI